MNFIFKHPGSGEIKTASLSDVEIQERLSDQGDMRWESTVKPEHFKVVGTSHDSTMKRCLHRATS